VVNCGAAGQFGKPGMKPTSSFSFEVFEVLTVPDKFKDALTVEDLDWTFRLFPEGIIICEGCGKTRLKIII
jgi:hypothetical protein